MGFLELLVLSIGLSMDACTVSMTDGMCFRKMKWGWTLAIGICFGCMQGLMPLLGFMLGSYFSAVISMFDHFIALILLGFIGAKMIYEAFHTEEESIAARMTVHLLLLQGIATSIDALAVGVSFAALQSINIFPAVTMISLTTFVFSIAGVAIGKRFGKILNHKAQILGGIILIGIGVKILVEHIWFS